MLCCCETDRAYCYSDEKTPWEVQVWASTSSFVRKRIEQGRYQNASEVVRAGLRLLEEYELSVEERLSQIRAKLDEAWDDPRPSIPADEAFGHVEALHAKTVRLRRDGG